MHRTTPAICLGALSAAALLAFPAAAQQGNSGQPTILSTGQRITPLAPAGARFEPLNPNLADNPGYTVGQAVSTVFSPDGRTLLVLTSGYNLINYSSGPNTGEQNNTDSTEFIFVFDVTGAVPVQKQAIPVTNTYSGIVWSPDGSTFFVPGGNADNVHVYTQRAGLWTETQTVALGHLAQASAARASAGGLGLATQPEAAGIAASPDGSRLLVANYENDSVTVLTRPRGYWDIGGELDLRPGKAKNGPVQPGTPGGEYPFWIQAKGNDLAYVSSVRDREVDLVSFYGVLDRIKLPGNPNKMVMNKAQTLLYVAQDNSDTVAVIDTNTQQVIDEIPVTAPAGAYANKQGYKGANPNSLALSPDEKTLYVTNGGENAVAVVRLNGTGNSEVVGLIPTGFYPNSVTVSADGRRLFVVNGKSDTGPNPQNAAAIPAVPAVAVASNAANQYTFQLTKAGFQTLPVPTDAELATLTTRVLDNDHFGRTLTPAQQETMAFLKQNIKHVIYIIKENRTYDQVLGDLEVGNGDPSITQFPEADTPNFHALARNFVDFDNFYDVANVSGDGWPWSTSARTTDVIEKEIPVNYGGRGIDNDSEGTNRNLNVGIGNTRARVAADPLTNPDPDLLPGTGNVAAPAAPDADGAGQGEGYLWNGALRAGLSVRDYGFFLDLVRYNLASAPTLSIPPDPNAFADKLQVAYSTNPVLSPLTDIYFRGFDNAFPDYFRFTEWNREFQQYEAAGNLPNLSLVRIMHDHFGNFGTAINGVNTPELQIADNDYAVASVIEAVSKSKDAGSTLVFVIEDDAQDGGDHVNAHRSTAFVAGPYVKQGFVDSTRYNTVSMLRTMEDILGIAPLNLNDANAVPMANAFDTKQAAWSFTATPSVLLKNTTLPIPASLYPASAALRPLHTGQWWAAHTREFDFSVEDHLDSAKFNRVVWHGTMGAAKPYPSERSGKDLGVNRAAFLKKFYAQKREAEAERAAQTASVAAGHNPGTR